MPTSTVMRICMRPSDLAATAAARMRTQEALDAAIRVAVDAGALAGVLAGDEGADGLSPPLLLEIEPGCVPAPSMLLELLAAMDDRTAGVRAREIPLDGDSAACRLSRAGTSVFEEVPSAVVFRDRRLRPDGREAQALPAEPTVDESRPLFLSVLMRTQGKRPRMLEEALTCLAAQTVTNFEVCLAVHAGEDEVRSVRALVHRFAAPFAERVIILPVLGGGRARPLNVALERAEGMWVACLDDDDLVTADWVEAFLDGSRAAPRSVVRSVTLNQRIEAAGSDEVRAYRIVGVPEAVFDRRFDLDAHLRDNSTPIMSFAVPRELVGNARFREDLPVLEDWEFLMRMALAGGVHDTDRATSIYHWWVSGTSSLDQAGEALWAESRRRVRESFPAPIRAQVEEAVDVRSDEPSSLLGRALAALRSQIRPGKTPI